MIDDEEYLQLAGWTRLTGERWMHVGMNVQPASIDEAVRRQLDFDAERLQFVLREKAGAYASYRQSRHGSAWLTTDPSDCDPLGPGCRGGYNEQLSVPPGAPACP